MAVRRGGTFVVAAAAAAVVARASASATAATTTTPANANAAATAAASAIIITATAVTVTAAVAAAAAATSTAAAAQLLLTSHLRQAVVVIPQHAHPPANQAGASRLVSGRGATPHAWRQRQRAALQAGRHANKAAAQRRAAGTGSAAEGTAPAVIDGDLRACRQVARRKHADAALRTHVPHLHARGRRAGVVGEARHRALVPRVHKQATAQAHHVVVPPPLRRRARHARIVLALVNHLAAVLRQQAAGVCSDRHAQTAAARAGVKHLRRRPLPPLQPLVAAPRLGAESHQALHRRAPVVAPLVHADAPALLSARRFTPAAAHRHVVGVQLARPPHVVLVGVNEHEPGPWRVTW